MPHQIEISALDGSGSFTAYVAEPAGTPKAAIVVIQEIFGINRGIRKMCDDWAAEGYLALAPDLFWRMEPNVELDADNQTDLPRAFDFYGRFDQDKGIADVEAAIRKARALSNAKVGVVGYCLGGRVAYLSATRTDADTIVSYYGGGIHEYLGESHAIGKPLMLHLAKADNFIGPEAQQAIHRVLDANRHVTIHDYEGQDHAFARAYGSSRNEAAANLADDRTRAFFAEHLA